MTTNASCAIGRMAQVLLRTFVQQKIWHDDHDHHAESGGDHVQLKVIVGVFWESVRVREIA